MNRPRPININPISVGHILVFINLLFFDGWLYIVDKNVIDFTF